MTIIEKIRAEIERRFREYNKDSNHHLQAAEDADLLSFLDTLESEKPMNQDGLEKEYEDYVVKDPCFSKLVNRNAGLVIARHFAQWGAEHLADARKTSPEDLEEAAIKYFDDNCYLGEVGFECDAVEAFIAGAKWQAEQLKK